MKKTAQPPARPEKPGLRDALFGELPPDWRDKRRAAPKGPARPPPPTARVRSILQLDRRDWFVVLKGVYREFLRDRVLSVSGGVTFFALLALFPAITTLVSIYGLFADPESIANHLNLLDRVLPPDVVQIIAGQINHITQTPVFTLSLTGTVSLLVAIYSATGGIKALIETLNLAWYETETRSFFRLNLIGLGFTFGAIFLLIALLTGIAVIPVALAWLHAPPEIESLISLTRWPVMFALLTLAIAALYHWGPDQQNNARHRVLPGTIAAALLLVAASVGFSWYVQNLAHYSETYGSLGAVVVLMMWLWIASIIVMIGAEFNAELSRRIDSLNGDDIEDDMKKAA
ncbi:YihY/virulence factor BrkB family protein [Paracoccus aminophilus]|uniref:Membrane protein n=1 Tax=Paracoccus aminophilus JCM 7686 TaxID=1367847 RepID=S5XWN6_PARAH|nr:YihY/virulence factor BrkB family protein [Paracoccus aminophilus]AGT07830.1 membrane protein [Paracoccus aminophilus JCM 7686]